MNNDAPLTRSKHSSPPRPSTMTSEAIIQELAHALRDTIVESDESYLRGDPEEAFHDLACRLIFRMKMITVVPAATPRETRETEFRRAEAESNARIFETLDQWLLARGAGVRSIEMAVNAANRREITMTEINLSDGENAEYEVKGFFQGESVRDACGQATQTVLFNGVGL